MCIIVATIAVVVSAQVWRSGWSAQGSLPRHIETTITTTEAITGTDTTARMGMSKAPTIMVPDIARVIVTDIGESRLLPNMASTA